MTRRGGLCITSGARPPRGASRAVSSRAATSDSATSAEHEHERADHHGGARLSCASSRVASFQAESQARGRPATNGNPTQMKAIAADMTLGDYCRRGRSSPLARAHVRAAHCGTSQPEQDRRATANESTTLMREHGRVDEAVVVGAFRAESRWSITIAPTATSDCDEADEQHVRVAAGGRALHRPTNTARRSLLGCGASRLRGRAARATRRPPSRRRAGGWSVPARGRGRSRRPHRLPARRARGRAATRSPAAPARGRVPPPRPVESRSTPGRERVQEDVRDADLVERVAESSSEGSCSSATDGLRRSDLSA